MKTKNMIAAFSLVFAFALIGGNQVKAQSERDNLPKYGKDSVACVQNLSLYFESYKQWKQSHYKNPAVDHAFKYWKLVYRDCPRASENTYVAGVKMLNYYIRKTESPERKQRLIDSLMMVYDDRIKYFPISRKTHKSQVGKILGRKGVDLYQLRPDQYKEAYEILKKSLELDKANSAAPVYVYYFRAITRMASKGEIDTAAVVDAYDQLSDYVEQNLKKYKEQGKAKKVEEYTNIMGNIELTFEPFAQCRELVRIYNQKFDKTPEDTELLKKIIKILEKKKCIEDPLYFQAVVKLYDLEPTPESAYAIGKMYIKQKRYKEAIPYMEAATKMADNEKVDDAYIFLAEAYRALDNFPKARQMALEAAKMNPTWGQPYIFIGDLYVMSATDCGDNDLTKKVAYWAAVDKYKKAKKVEPDLTELANERIKRYSVYFPSKELLFFYALNDGDKYTVDCWINEVTTVRAAK
ncbi:MAG: tetratricopeptide repeat protein [Chlorobi bacterium]|nr:tetratricopeptide repeat protein [Chlorobiota bacterium]